MTGPTLRHLRTGAAVAALVLAVLSRGDTLVLGAVLAAVAYRRVATFLLPALLAVAWRWGSTSLEAISGAQAVLGAAVTVGPASAAIACGTAGLAVLLLAAPEPGDDAPSPLLVAVVVGAAVALIVAGPAPGGDIWMRVLAGLVAAGAAMALDRLRVTPRARLVLDGVGATMALAALAAASVDAPGWEGTRDSTALAEGLVVAVAAIVLVVVGAAAMGHRRA